MNIDIEISKEFLTTARGYIRITAEDTVIDNDITDLIKACMLDLIRNGITSKKATDTNDSLIKMAIRLYLKAEYGLDNKNHEKYRASYEMLRTELALTRDYTEVSEDVE